jgi:hypothetical protein
LAALISINAGQMEPMLSRSAPLFRDGRPKEFRQVNRYLAIRRLLAVSLIACLALAPVSRPVTAATSAQEPMQAMADEMSPPDTMDEMASDMPCCPTKAPVPVDCDKCVLMAACMSIYFTGLWTGVFHPFPILSDRIALQRNDTRPDGLGHPPPEHPPRLLV